MGNAVGGRESIDDEADACGISDFEHCFAASLEDASPGVIREPVNESNTPSMVPHTNARRRSADTINAPLSGRLVMVHMMETELVLCEIVGVVEQTVASMPYAAIRRLTWDHSQSSLKVGHAPVRDSDSGFKGRERDPDDVYLSIRVENSLELEYELQQRARAGRNRAAKSTAEELATNTSESVYLGMFAGYTKPKPFERKHPNLSFTVPEGELPTLKDMRRWAQVEHEGASRPHVISQRSRLAMDAVYLGENRFPLSDVNGLSASLFETFTIQQSSRCGELVLTFGGVDVQLRDDCGKGVKLPYDVIDDWTTIAPSGAGGKISCGLELWILRQVWEESGQCFRSGGGTEESHHGIDGGENVISPVGSREDFHRIFVGVPEEDLVLARNSMEFLWNRSREDLRRSPKAGSTHGRRVVSKVTLRGEVKAPPLPTGRLNPIDLEGVEIRVGKTVHPSPRRGQVNLILSPRTILGVEKKRTIRHNAQARPQWERVVLHQGWLRKRGGGAIKRWIWRYFVLFDTPQGHFLAYYDDASDVPLFSEGRRERQLIDLCKVCFLRPEITRPRLPASEIPANAFTIVTAERQWTLCADSKASLMRWLRMLSLAVDEDVAIVDDREALFHVKVQWSPDGKQYGPECPATVHLGTMGMELKWGFPETTSPLAGYAQPMCAWSGGDGGTRVMAAGKTKFWSFTDFYKWTLVVLHYGIPGLAIQCFTDEEFVKRENVLLVTPRSKQLALVIEHQIEKFMALMHLRLELPGNSSTACAVSSVDDTSSESMDDESEPHLSPEFRRITSMNLATDPGAWVGQTLRTDHSGRNNPFDLSSGAEDEDDEDDDGDDAWEVAGLPGGSETATGTAPDPWSKLLDEPATNTAREEKCYIRDGTQGALETPFGVEDETTEFTLSGPSDRIRQLYPPASPPPPPTVEATEKQVARPTATSSDPFDVYQAQQGGALARGAGDMRAATSDFALFDSEVLDFSSTTNSSSGESAAASPPNAAGGESPSTSNKFLTPLQARSSPGSTPPITPLATTPFEDGATWRGPQHAVIAMLPVACVPEDRASQVFTKESDGKSNVHHEHTNPFASPRNRVLPPRGEQAALKVAGEVPPTCPKVLHNDRVSMRITLESCATGGSSCFLGLKYELSALAPSATVTVSVGFLPGPAALALDASFDPPFDSFSVVGTESGGRKELKQTISLSCSHPFSCPPKIAIVIAGGREPPARTRVSLPISVSTFLKGLPLSTDEFRQRWTSLSSSGQTNQAIVGDGGHHAGLGCVQRARVQPADVKRLLFKTIGMSEVPWTDKGGFGDVDLVAASGVLTTSGSEDMGSMACLVGVELHGATGAVRVTTKSTDRALTESIQKEILRGIDVARSFHR